MSTPVTRNSKITFITAIAVAAFWILSASFRIYEVHVLGIIFEWLGFPLLLVTLLIPVWSVIFLFKEKFNFRSLYLYSILIVVATVVYLQYFR